MVVMETIQFYGKACTVTEDKFSVGFCIAIQYFIVDLFIEHERNLEVVWYFEVWMKKMWFTKGLELTV